MLWMVINMNIQKITEHKDYRIAQIALPKQAVVRLRQVGIYIGAIVQIERLGKKGKPSLLLVCGNVYMMRQQDLSQIEFEVV